MNKHPQFIAVILLIFALYTLMPEDATATGYIGELVTKALPDGRSLELVQPYSYEDSDGRQWGVPKGTIVDGASIPQVFWSIVGGPFSGKYRSSSVIHDYYCDTMHRDWRAVHNLFYEAMLTSGVSKNKAMLMYYAVYRFGKRWKVKKWQPSCPPGVLCAMDPGVGLEFEEESLPYIQADVEEFQRFTDMESPSIDNTRTFANKQIERLGFHPDKSTKTEKKFYPDYQDFPDNYDFLLNDWELRTVQNRREGN